MNQNFRKSFSSTTFTPRVAASTQEQAACNQVINEAITGETLITEMDGTEMLEEMEVMQIIEIIAVTIHPEDVTEIMEGTKQLTEMRLTTTKTIKRTIKPKS